MTSPSYFKSNSSSLSKDAANTPKYHGRHWTAICHLIQAKVKRLGAVKLLLLVVLSILLVGHRIYVQYERTKFFVHVPITFLPRECPEPSYPTMAEDPQEVQEASKICLTTLTDERSQSWMQRVVRWRNFDGLLKMTWQNKVRYAQKHGYYLFDESASLDMSRPPSWSKILAVKRLLVEENCTWVWWVDADTVIMNSAKRLEDFLPSEQAPQDLLISRDHRGEFNAGGWLLRNSAFALEFLEEWWNMKSHVKLHGLPTSGDNDAFKQMLATLPELDQHALVPPACTFNAFAYFTFPKKLELIDKAGPDSEWYVEKQMWYQNEVFYHKGDLLAHVAGYNNKEGPVQMLLDIAE